MATDEEIFKYMKDVYDKIEPLDEPLKDLMEERREQNRLKVKQWRG